MGAGRIPGVFQRRLALRCRVARARCRPAIASRPGDRPVFRRRSAPRPAGITHRLRSCLAVLAACLIGTAHAQVLSTRIWPAPDYTRLTLESKAAIKHSLFSLKDPERLVIDLETEELSAALD